MHQYIFVDTIKIIKYLKIAPTCFGSQRIHHQGVAKTPTTSMSTNTMEPFL